MIVKCPCENLFRKLPPPANHDVACLTPTLRPRPRISESRTTGRSRATLLHDRRESLSHLFMLLPFDSLFSVFVRLVLKTSMDLSVWSILVKKVECGVKTATKSGTICHQRTERRSESRIALREGGSVCEKVTTGKNVRVRGPRTDTYISVWCHQCSQQRE